MKSVIVIPARMASTRLPGKPLLEAGGRSLLEHVYKAARHTIAKTVAVATADPEIAAHCETSGCGSQGMNYVRTLTDYPTGTHKCAEAVKKLRCDFRPDVIVNWQCDEVSVPARAVDELINVFRWNESDKNEPVEIATLVNAIDPDCEHEEGRYVYREGDVLAAVSQGRCWWFSRRLFVRRPAQHVGIYAYTADTLSKLGRLTETEHSRAERLEQLAWIEHGYAIHAVYVDETGRAINSQADFERFKRVIEGTSR